MREIGDPIVDVITPHQYTAWQQAFDALQEPGARNYWKSHNFVEITDGMIETFVQYAESMPTPLSEIAVAQLDGATKRVPVAGTAYSHRDAEFVMISTLIGRIPHRMMSVLPGHVTSTMR